VLAVAATMTVLVLAHVQGINGPWYWRWAWRRLGYGIYPLMLAGASPVLLAPWLQVKRAIRPAPLVPLPMLGAVLMQAASLTQQPLGIARLAAIVENSVNTSYYSAAKVLVEQMDKGGMSYRNWLEVYPELMEKLMLHASFKPPGLILYYIAMIRLF